MNSKEILRDVLCLMICVVWLCLPSSAAAQEAAGVAAETVTEATGISWQPRVEYARLVLTVSAPDGHVFRQEFGPGSRPEFKVADGKGFVRADGNYTYELRVIPVASAAVSAAVKESRWRGDDGAAATSPESARLMAKAITQSGSFLVRNGEVAAGDAVERADRPSVPDSPTDFVINDDLIVLGSTCIGFDCVNGETFDADTLRFRENNLRIHFDDTSTGSFPKNDWRITVNETASGGASKFSIDDVTGAKTPFTIRAGAPSNSLFVTNFGSVGLGTATPSTKIHAVNGDTPTLRLDQSSSLGFDPQTWDMGGNEVNFFIRDVTSGSKLPFRIRPGAPTSSIDIAANGDVGIGDASPSFKLDVNGTIRSASGGFVFPDGTTQTTAAGPSAGTKADDVSAGQFGKNTGGGNYSFPMRLGIGVAAPGAKLQVEAGDIYVTDATRGIILKSPNGTCRRIRLADDGTLTISNGIACP